MIDIMFEFQGDFVLVRIRGNKITFSHTTFFDKEADISGLNLSKDGVVKEFPDLKDKDNWREESIKRFKEKIRDLGGELEISNYLISDLSKHGYKPMYRQRGGHRREELNGGFN